MKFDVVTYALLKKYIDSKEAGDITEDDVKAIIAESIASGAIKTAIEDAVKDSLKVKVSEE